MAQLALDVQTATLLNNTSAATQDSFHDGVNMAGQGPDVPALDGYSDLSSGNQDKAQTGMKSMLAGLLKSLGNFAPTRNVVSSFSNGFSLWGDGNYNSGQVTYRKNTNGEVYLEGLVKVPNTYAGGSIDILTLPVGFRPAANQGKIFATIGNDVMCSIQVGGSGVVTLRTGGTADGWLSLDSIRFPAGG